MPRSFDSLTLEDAKRMLSAAEAKPAGLAIAYNIAIVDAGGHLGAFIRQDGALIGSIDLAIDKAVTARIFDKATSDLASLAQPGKPLFGIQESNAGKVVIFGGGIPMVRPSSPSPAISTSSPSPRNTGPITSSASRASLRQMLRRNSVRPRARVNSTQ